MQRAVLRQLARAGHICGAEWPKRRGRKHGGLYCVLEPGHAGDHDPNLRHMPSSPVMRERIRRAKAVVAHESAERHVAALTRRLEAAERRRAWTEGFLGFRVEYRVRGAYRRLRRYYRFISHRTWKRRQWQRETWGRS